MASPPPPPPPRHTHMHVCLANFNRTGLPRHGVTCTADTVLHAHLLSSTVVAKPPLASSTDLHGHLSCDPTACLTAATACASGHPAPNPKHHITCSITPKHHIACSMEHVMLQIMLHNLLTEHSAAQLCSAAAPPRTILPALPQHGLCHMHAIPKTAPMSMAASVKVV